MLCVQWGFVFYKKSLIYVVCHSLTKTKIGLFLSHLVAWRLFPPPPASPHISPSLQGGQHSPGKARAQMPFINLSQFPLCCCFHCSDFNTTIKDRFLFFQELSLATGEIEQTELLLLTMKLYYSVGEGRLGMWFAFLGDFFSRSWVDWASGTFLN